MLPGLSCLHPMLGSAAAVVSDSVTPWVVVGQAPLSMGCSREESWGGLLCPLAGDLPDPGLNLHFLCVLHWQAGSLPLASPGKPIRYTLRVQFPRLSC